MTVESDADLVGLKRIGQIVGLTLKEMKKHVRSGITTAELDAIGGEFLSRYGARSAPSLVYNFPGFTCISLNDEAAHGIPGQRVIQPGDLVNLDVSAELDGYFADSAVMVAVPPSNRVHKKLISCTQAALRRGIEACQAGLPMNVIGRAVESEAKRCGLTILRNVNGHGVGRNIHEEPHSVANTYNRFERRRLTEGMVITIEPFFSTGPDHVITGRDGWTLRTPDGSPSAQVEHTIVVTRKQPIVITAIA
jgi:methionyl aminopeptidase